MASDFDKILNSFMQGKTNENLTAIKNLLSTEENKKLLISVLGDGSVAKKAVLEAKSGDMSTARSLLASLASTPGGAALISSIASAIEGTRNG